MFFKEVTINEYSFNLKNFETNDLYFVKNKSEKVEFAIIIYFFLTWSQV